MTADTLWADVADRLRGTLNTTTYRTWFGGAAGAELTDDTFVIGVPNDFTREWIEGHFLGLIRAAVKDATGNERRIQLRVRLLTREPVEDEEARRDGPAMPVDRVEVARAGEPLAAAHCALGGEPLAAPRTAALQDQTAGPRGHSRAKAVLALAAAHVRLVGAFHRIRRGRDEAAERPAAARRGV